MAVPKRKTSKARRDSRRSANSKLSIPSIEPCPKCHEPKLSHTVCKACGTYNGRQVFALENEQKKAKD
ncbi:MAG: 50S ribosomal protein L32 [Clostridia bacterium]